MDKVRLGKTELTVNKNGFGALPIQRITKKEAVYLLQKAFYNGINYFDTARAYTDSEETHVSVFRAEPLPIGGGAAHFLYRRAKRTDPLCSAIISAFNDLLLVALASNTSISFYLSIPYCPTNGVQFRSPGALFIPEGLEKTIVRKFSHPAYRSTSAP